MDTVWTFRTNNFRVSLLCEEESYPDLSWADQETLDKLERGEWYNLTFKVEVRDRNTGQELGSDYLGNSIYGNPAEFRDHVGARGKYGSYFIDMVHNAIAEARAEWARTAARVATVHLHA